MSTSQDGAAPGEVGGPTVSTAPTGGSTPPAGRRFWHWGALPDHLGRARTSTAILSVLFLAIFTLYLNVRPDVQPTGTSPAGGGSDVEAPADPIVPSEPDPTEEPADEPTGEPTPTTGPDATEPADEPTGAPTTSPSSPRPTGPTTGPSSPPGTSEPAGPTGGTTDQDTPAPSTSSAP